ncbi:MAG: hypothetical protein HY855_01675 [Burkholderiales bacterium]|nr:hypothetical protein [Burkholderiales bacterium]
MNIFTGEQADAFFGGEVPAPVRSLLQQAAQRTGDERSTLLWTAQAIAPACLAPYYALYKHHTGRRELALAERAAWRGLAEAALQAGLPADWRAVQPASADFQADGPARFWLFTLKALAFISLRNGQPAAAGELLAAIDRIDAHARIGSDVTAALLASVRPREGRA